MDPKAKFALYKFSVWCGLAVLVANTVAFFYLGKLFPPPDPAAGAAQVQAFLLQNRTGILWSVVLMGLAAPFFYFFAVVTSLQMRRIEGGWGLLSMVQLTTAVVAPTGWVYPLATLAVAVFRPDRDASLVYLVSDQFWLTYVGVAFIFSINVASIGLAALLDRRPNPVFPRWSGYMNLVLALLFMPGVFIYAFQDGPLAWNGLLALWIPSTAFPIWKFLMIYILLRAVKQEQRESAAAASGAVPVPV